MTGTNDKLRGLFLTMLMVTSVFAGTIAFSGAAAAANEDPEILQANENNGAIQVAFSDDVMNATSGNDLSAEADNFILYVREAGTEDFTRYNITSGVTANSSARYTIAKGAHTGSDLSAASEVLLSTGEIQPTTRDVSSDDNVVTINNVSVDLSTYSLDEGTTDNNARGDAQRVYQGAPITFNADASGSGDDTPTLLENVETGEILLDGSTGENSRQIVFDSDNLESGTTYKLTFEEGTTNTETEKYFNVTSLRLSASLEEDGTTFEHDATQEINVEGSAIRGNEDVAIEVHDEEGNTVFVGNDTLSNRAEFDATLSNLGLGAGDYTVEVIDVQTGVSVTAGSFSVDEFPTADSASFGQGVVQEERGDVAEIPIRLQNSVEGAQAHVSIGSLGDTNYIVNVTVADTDGDGEVTLLFNTFNAGSQNLSQTFSAEGGEVSNMRTERGSFVQTLSDRYNQTSNTDLLPNVNTGSPDEARNVPENESLQRARLGTLDAASYELAIKAAEVGDFSSDINFSENDAQDVGTLQLNSRATEDSQVYRVPADKSDSLDLEFIQNSLDNNNDTTDGNLTQTDTVTNQEVIIHQISASGIEGIFANQTDAGTNVTQAFLNEQQDLATATGTTEEGAFVTGFQQLDPDPNADQVEFDLNNGNTEVIADYENDTYYIAVPIEGVNQNLLTDGRAFEANFTINQLEAVGPILGGDSASTVSSEWEYQTATGNLDTVNNRVEIRAAEDQRITGSSNVAPGTQLSARFQSQSDTSPFLETLDTRVQEDGSFVFQSGDTFADKASGVNFTVSVRRSGTEIAGPYDGRLLGEPTASVSISEQTLPGEGTQAVTVDSATLSDGGFIAIHEGDASGPVIGSSKFLQAGSHENVRVALDQDVSEETTLVAMPHVDSNGNNVYEFGEVEGVDGPYTQNGSAVTDSATVSVGADTPTPTETETPTPTETEEQTPTETEEQTPTEGEDTPTETEEPDTPSPTTTEGEGPGFGIVVSVLALLAAALLAARRRD